jgi:quinol monooxygenase YgiN
MDQTIRTKRSRAQLASSPRKSRVVWVIAGAVARRTKEKQLRSLLRRMVAPTHAEHGCLIYDLYESEKPGTFYFYELWASRQDLQRHATSSHFQRLLQALPEFTVGSIEVSLLNKLNL